MILSEPNLLEQLQILCEPLANHIKNHSYLGKESVIFPWFFLHPNNFQRENNRESPFNLTNILAKSFKILFHRNFRFVLVLLNQNLLGHMLSLLCISIAVFEEKDFWEKLHYKLPHKKMKKILPKQTEIELETVPFVNQNSV